ncbi:hypothetical protein BC831DRAFT_266044 [Entophlyctis helioformis]|nr:hypothetical protein BC831DRAFT_266044 [Entophlyctis helioformis]
MAEMQSCDLANTKFFGPQTKTPLAEQTPSSISHDTTLTVYYFTAGLWRAALALIGAMVADLVKLDADAPLPLEYCVLEASQGKLTQYYYVNPKDFDEDESATLLSGGCIHKQGIIVWHMYGTGPHSSDTKIPRYGSLVTLDSDTALKICAFDTAKIAKQSNMHC